MRHSQRNQREIKLMAFDLSSIGATKHAYPPRILLHGNGGAGKSTFFSECNDSIFIQTENGLSGIEAQAFPLAKTYDDVMDQLRTLAKEDHDFKAVWIDSADWLENLVHRKVCQDHNVKTIELAAGGYGKGYLEAMNLWRGVLTALDWLRENKSMFTGFTCHSQIQHVDDPEHEGGYDRYSLKLHNSKKGIGSLSTIYEWADVVGFLKVVYQLGDQEIARGDVKKMKNVTQARQLCLEEHAAYQAKNRFGLTPQIEIIKGEGWSSFLAELTNAQ